MKSLTQPLFTALANPSSWPPPIKHRRALNLLHAQCPCCRVSEFAQFRAWPASHSPRWARRIATWRRDGRTIPTSCSPRRRAARARVWGLPRRCLYHLP
jgi:hypothetical protein